MFHYSEYSTTLSWPRLVGLFAQLYTGAGGVLALLCIMEASSNNINRALLFIFLAAIVDATDGSFARRTRAASALPEIDGSKLDGIVDFSTNVISPAYILLKTHCLPNPNFLFISLIIISSCFRYCRTDNPWRSQGFLRGLPVPWSFFLFYSVFLPIPPAVSGAAVILLSVFQFAPIRFIHISKLGQFRLSSAAAFFSWWAIYLLVSQGIIKHTLPWILISLSFPLYYLTLSVALHRRPPKSNA